MNEFDENSEEFDNLKKNFDKLREELNENLLKEDTENLEKNLNELRGLSRKLGAIDEDVSEILNNKFFLIGVDNYNSFNELVLNEISDYKDNYSIFGFSFSDLEILNDKFKKYNVTALFIQYELMAKASKEVNLDQLFSFEPITGKERKGILIPVSCNININKDKPKRDVEIDEIDINILGSKLDAFNNGDISFEEFLGSI
jgi:hypothetical protein